MDASTSFILIGVAWAIYELGILRGEKRERDKAKTVRIKHITITKDEPFEAQR